MDADSAVTVQLIESGGILLTACIAMFAYWRIINIRKLADREIDLLLDCFFYRQIIEKYKALAKEHEDKTYEQQFRDEVESQYDITSSRHSQPKAIEKRLKKLRKRDKQIDDFLSKIG